MTLMNVSTKQTQETQRTDLWLPRGRRDGRGMNYKFGISRCKLSYREMINNKVLLYSTGNYIHIL